MLGTRSFAVAGPVIWNSLPTALRTAALTPLTFARHLKAHLFGRSIARLRIIYDALYSSSLSSVASALGHVEECDLHTMSVVVSFGLLLKLFSLF